MGLFTSEAIPVVRCQGSGSVLDTSSALRELPMWQTGWIIKENTKEMKYIPRHNIKKNYATILVPLIIV